MRNFRRVVSSLSLMALLLAPLAILWQKQNIIDWWRLRSFEPSPQVAALTEHTAMTSKARKLFYVHFPELNDRTTFNHHCKSVEHTIVLGCYISHQSIHIFDVEDERLEGIKEVTAAHEMLHAAYDRLSDSERSRVDSLTKAAYESLEDDRLRKVIESYRGRDPAVVPNELHSILGTEVRNLPDDLEDYYKSYFTDRTKVVSLSEQYEQIFTRQRERLETVRVEIERLEKQLEAERQRINSMEREIVGESERLNRLRSENRIEQYNAGVPAYNARINDYRAAINSYNEQVKNLNTLIEEYNQSAIQQKQLFDAINSKTPGQ